MTEHGQQQTVLHAFSPVEIMRGDKVAQFNHRAGWIDVRDLSGRPDPPWLRGALDPFHMGRLGALLYVQINTVADTPEESLAHFAMRLHDEIATSKPESVAIDLRLNRGGDATLSSTPTSASSASRVARRAMRMETRAMPSSRRFARR